MKKALLTGTFDPPTLGHLNVIERAAKLCDKLLIGVAQNLKKSLIFFSVEERVALLKELTASISNVEVVPIKGLTVTFAKEQGVDVLIRGLRPFSDANYESQMALANKKLEGLETLFLVADGAYAHISSSLIREIASTGHHLKDFVPSPIEAKVCHRLQERLSVPSSKTYIAE
ncbi:MAG: pantetheine-phosphate adenylyltransferase [Chlamydiales bacterium]